MENSVDTKFLIVSAAYNVEEWVEQTFMSVVTQKYKNWEWIFIDDNSNDNTVKSFYSLFDRVSCDVVNKISFVEKKSKSCSLENIVKGVDIINPDDETVIIILDGDDWFTGNDVLSTLNKVYVEKECWLTYGSYLEYPSYRMGAVHSPYPKNVVEDRSFRKADWHGSHLRTFKYGLFKNINRNDLKDKDGNYYTTAGDLALMFPMLEMAGERICWIKKTLYVYNDSNPLNDHKIVLEKQREYDQLFRSMKKYNRLESF